MTLFLFCLKMETSLILNCIIDHLRKTNKVRRDMLDVNCIQRILKI